MPEPTHPGGPTVSKTDADRFKRLIASLHVGVVVQGPASEVLIVNQAALDLLGLTEAEMLQMTSFDPYWKIVREDGSEFPASDRPVSRVVATRTRVSNVVMGVHRPRTHDVTWLLVNAEPELDQDGNVTQVVATLGDITELKRLEQSLHQARRLEAIGRLAGGIAHDFNNLLTIILGANSMALATSPPGEASRDALEQSLAAAQRAAALTRQLLTFASRQITTPQSIDAAATLRALEPLLTRLMGENVELTIETQPGTWNVRVDPAQLEQVVVNLAVNAREAMPRGGKLKIATRNLSIAEPAGDFVVLEVSDNGPGMDAQTRERIFEPFFSTKKTGTGLGLATVHGILEKHSGSIAVQSELGRGATFMARFPRCLEPEARRVAPLPAGVQSSKAGEVVLVVEDQEMIRSLAKQMLERAGYRTLLAANGLEAVELARSAERIDLVLTDLVMPHLDGQATAIQLAKLRGGIKIIFTSGYTEDVPDLPPGRFLPKPYTPRQLLERIRAVLDE